MTELIYRENNKKSILNTLSRENNYLRKEIDNYRNMIGHLLSENSKLSMKCRELHTLVDAYRSNSYVVHAIKEMVAKNEGVLIWFGKGEFVVRVYNPLIEPIHDENIENAIVKAYVEWYQLEQKGDME